MSHLRSYQLWLSDVLGLLGEGKSRRAEKQDGSAISPLFKLVEEEMSNKNAEIITKQLKDTKERLLTAKKFVVPPEFCPGNHLGNPEFYDGVESTTETFYENPHLPHPVMFFQLERDSLFRGYKEKDGSVTTVSKLEHEIKDGSSTIKYWCLIVWQEPRSNDYHIECCGIRIHSTGKLTYDYMPGKLRIEAITKEDGRRDCNLEVTFPPWAMYADFERDAKVDDIHRVRDGEGGFKSTASLFHVEFGVAALCLVDLINNYPIEKKESQGLKIIGPKTKLKAFTKIQHSVIHLNRPYYEQVAVEKEERERRRLRLHDVRGHWRTYKSGRRIWIASHSRGDESLGRVVSEYDL